MGESSYFRNCNLKSLKLKPLRSRAIRGCNNLLKPLQKSHDRNKKKIIDICVEIVRTRSKTACYIAITSFDSMIKKNQNGCYHIAEVIKVGRTSHKFKLRLIFILKHSPNNLYSLNISYASLIATIPRKKLSLKIMKLNFNFH